jgi:hypothetical protein
MSTPPDKDDRPWLTMLLVLAFARLIKIPPQSASCGHQNGADEGTRSNQSVTYAGLLDGREGGGLGLPTVSLALCVISRY